MYLHKMNLRNFKSFKKGEIQFKRGINAIVGDNGQGKSNVVDAFIFGCGESSMLKMRAQDGKAKGLCYHGTPSCAVELVFRDEKDGEREHSIKREIRIDGKQRYFFNGKRSQKSAIKEFLGANGILDTNVVMQSKVERVVQMNAKERRMIIEEVANIEEYEEKKREAEGKLEAAAERLNAARNILGERESILEMLKRDKEDAEKYLKLRTELNSVKATLHAMEVKSLTGLFEDLSRKIFESQEKVRSIEREMSQYDGKLSECNSKRDALQDQLVLKSSEEERVLQDQIVALQSIIARSRDLIEDRRQEIVKCEGEGKELKYELQQARDSLSATKKILSDLEADVKAVQEAFNRENSSLNALVESSNKFEAGYYDAKKLIEDGQNRLLEIRDEINRLQSEIEKNREIIKLKEAEKNRLQRGDFADFGPQIREKKLEQKQFELESSRLEKVLSDLLLRERNFNNRLSSIDSELLEAKTKCAGLSASMKSSRSRRAMESIEALNALKEKLPGIHGTVQQLCDYDSEYAIPVQIALGNRKDFVVVDGTGTGKKAIGYLKQMGLPRVTFIPLDKIQAPPVEEDQSGAKGAIDYIYNILRFDSSLQKAFRFACANTLLMRDIDSAEKMIGKSRTVTLDGELFEKYGTMTGGKTEKEFDYFKTQREVDELEAKISSLSSEKSEIISSLEAIREEGKEHRTLKNKADLSAKTVEIELEGLQKSQKAGEEKRKDIKAEVKSLESDVEKAGAEIIEMEEGKRTLIREMSSLNIALTQAKQRVDTEQQKEFGIRIKEKQKAVSDLKIRLSELSAKSESERRSALMDEKRVSELERRLSVSEKELQEFRQAIEGASAEIKRAEKELSEKNALKEKMSAKFRDIYKKIDALQAECAEYAKRKGALNFEAEGIERKKQDLSIERAKTEANLLNAQQLLEEYPDAAIIECADKARLLVERKKLEPLVQELEEKGINQKAIEEYELKARELDDQKKKVELLELEKEAVYSMISEIDLKKRELFIKTFSEIRDAFRRLMDEVFKAEGILELENPESPFEGGLLLKVKWPNKHFIKIDAMSGGERSLISCAFIISIQVQHPNTVYILDEVDAALSDYNQARIVSIVKELSKTSQFIVISHHNKTLLEEANCLVGVSMPANSSMIVGVDLNKYGKDFEKKGGSREREAQ